MKVFLQRFLSVIFIFFLFFALTTKAEALSNTSKISNSTNQAVFPQLTADNNGYLHMAWMEVATTNEIWGSHQNPGIFYSRWNGDTWSTPLKISDNTGFAEIPSITSDSLNTIHAVWDDETYGEFGRVVYKTRNAAGTWSAIETLPLQAGAYNSWNSRVAVDSNNQPNVIYSSSSSTGDSIWWTKKESGVWTNAELISKDNLNNTLSDCQWSDLRSNASGTIQHVIYWCWGSGIWYRSYSGTSWTTPFNVSSSAIEYTKMVVTPGGEVFVAWYNPVDLSIYVRYTQSGGQWQNPTVLTNAGFHSFWGFPILGLTTDSKERTHVGWGEQDVNDGLIDLKYKTFASGVWGAVQDVDLNNNDADSPFVYPDKWDNQHFVWTEKNPSTNQWEIYYRVAEGTVATVPTSGSTVTANPNNTTYATLAVPNGGLSVATQIGIQIGPVPESVGTTQATIPRSFTFRPSGLTFLSPATATVFYDDAELAGADERLLKPWFWNGTTNAWEARSGTVNRPQNKIAVTLNGFSLYGISAPLFDTPIWNYPSENMIIKQTALPVDFELRYKDGNSVLPPQSADELFIQVKDSLGNNKDTIYYGPSGIIRTGQNRYKGVVNTAKSIYQSGNYSIEIYMADTLVGKAHITLAK